MTVVKLSERETRGSNEDESTYKLPKDPQRKRRRRIRYFISVPLLIVFGFIALAFNTDYIPSESMEPTLKPGDHIVTMRAWIAYPFGTMPARGDIITFRLSPENQVRDAVLSGNPINSGNTGGDNANSADAATELGGKALHTKLPKPIVLIKRVIGLPGDKVQIRDNTVFINGRKLQEDYQTLPGIRNAFGVYPYAVDQPLTVPAGQIFVLGDNRTNSDDGRFWGTLNRSDVLGKYVTKLFHRNIPAVDDNAGGMSGT
jgi:signal peptidase I